MILNVLADYYQELVEKNKGVNVPGWQIKKVGHELLINKEGELLDIVSTAYEEEQIVKGKPKKVKLVKEVLVPHIDRSGSGMNPIFLCDTPEYILGVSQKDDEKKRKKKLNSMKELCQEILKEQEDFLAKALLNFYKRWDLKIANEHSKIHKHLDNKDFLTSNLIFRLDETNEYLHEDLNLQNIWNNHLKKEAEGITLCSISGNHEEIARLHPKIKGLYGGQAAGGSLISYNSRAFEYFGKVDGSISPISEQVAHAYASALTWLLKRENKHISQMGNVAVLFWSKTGNQTSDNMVDMLFNPKNDEVKTLAGFFEKMIRGDYPTDVEKELESDYYVLGLAPNNARISIKFFMSNTVGYFFENIEDHFSNLDIVGPPDKKTLTIRDLLSETINKNSNDKNPKEDLSIGLVKAILEKHNYPIELVYATISRMRAEIHGDDKTAQYAINYRRMAIIRAYLIRNINYTKEKITVALNKEWDNTAYLLGRLFATYEKIQEDAPGGNATIKGSYFSSASTTPASIFPNVTKSGELYLGKMNEGSKIYFSRIIGEIMNLLPAKHYPKNLAFDEQNIFILGYYHQRQDLFTKKDEVK